ncbi:MAG TPA: hypothetical protein VF132_15285, partial [Rudaea sp.]
AVVSSATIPIMEAIRNRRLLAFDYRGGARVIEPHTYGLDKWKREVVCGYQVEGDSSSGKPKGWRTFVIADAANIRAEARHFAEPRPEYRRDDGAFAQIIAQL